MRTNGSGHDPSSIILYEENPCLTSIIFMLERGKYSLDTLQLFIGNSIPLSLKRGRGIGVRVLWGCEAAERIKPLALPCAVVLGGSIRTGTDLIPDREYYPAHHR